MRDAAAQEGSRKRKPSVSTTGKAGKKPRSKQSAKSKAFKSNARGKGKQRSVTVDDDEEEAAFSGESDNEEVNYEELPDEEVNVAPRRSTRARKAARGAYREDSDEDEPQIIEGDQAEQDAPMDIDLDAEDVPPRNLPTDSAESGESRPDEGAEDEMNPVTEESLANPGGAYKDPFLEAEEEEEKPKPILQLKFRGFNIFGKTLCVVVEPWPPLQFSKFFRATSSTPSEADRAATRERSIAPPEFVASYEAERQAREGRAKTPLFLPERSVTPAFEGYGSREASAAPFSVEGEAGGNEGDEGEESEMMLFSQVLNSVGGDQVYGNDDELDMGALFGDADEMRLIVE